MAGVHEAKLHPLFPLTLVELAPAHQVAPPVAAESLMLVQSIATEPLDLDKVDAVPALEEMILATLPDEAVVVNPLRVRVLEAGKETPVVSPRLFKANTFTVIAVVQSKTTFLPLTVILLYVRLVPPVNDLALAWVVLVISMVEVLALRVNEPILSTFQTLPVPVNDHVLAPMVNVLKYS